MTFLKDLEKGKQGESILAAILENCGYKVTLSRSKFWDCVAQNGKKLTFEVKYDLYAAKSGNIAIEYHNSKIDKPSGILATRADFWAHILDKPLKVLVCRSDILKVLVKDILAGRHTQYKPLRLIKSGGNKNSNMILFSILEIENLFVNFNTLSNMEIKKFLTK